MAGETRDFYFAIQNLNRATIKYAAGMIKALCENYNDEWRKGFLNLDFLGNLGHSLDKNILTVTDWNE